MSNEHDPGDSRRYMQKLLKSQRTGQGEVTHYLKKLGNLHAEFNEPHSSSSLLESYLAKTGAPNRAIDLTSSYSALPPDSRAAKLSADAGNRKSEAIAQESDAMIGQLNAIYHRIISYQKIIDNTQSLMARSLSKIAPTFMLELLQGTMASVPQDDISATIGTMTLHPMIADVVMHRGDPCYLSSIPNDPKNMHLFNRSALTVIQRLAEGQLHGVQHAGHACKPGLLHRYETLDNDYFRQKDRLVIAAKGREQANCELKPAIIHLMEYLQAIERSSIKPDNICIAKGSSTIIMEVALDALIPPSNTPPKLILFDMSWDGLKAYASALNLELSLVKGGVDAQALDRHIKDHLLSGNAKTDLAEAREQLKKTVGGILLSIPENPLGKMPSEFAMRQLAAVIEKYDVPVVVVDEIFAAPGYQSLSTYPGMAKRCYVVSSTSKNINGGNKFSYGYSANDDFAGNVRSAIHEQHSLHPLQVSIMSSLLTETPDSYYADNQKHYAAKRQHVTQRMQHVNQQNATGAAMRWLQEPNYGCLGVIVIPVALTDKAGIRDSCELAEYIYKMGGVMTVPVSSMTAEAGEPIGVRINFSGCEREMDAAIDRIGIAMQQMETYRLDDIGRSVKPDIRRRSVAVGGRG